jgi:hypothetical protein
MSITHISSPTLLPASNCIGKIESSKKLDLNQGDYIKELGKRIDELKVAPQPQEFSSEGRYVTTVYYISRLYKKEDFQVNIIKELIRLKEEIKSNPKNLEAKGDLAAFNLLLHYKEETARLYKEMKTLNPHYSKIYYLDYQFQVYQGIPSDDRPSLKKAILNLRKCLAIDPEFDPAKNDLSFLKTDLIFKLSKHAQKESYMQFIQACLNDKDPFEGEKIDFDQLHLSAQFLKKYPKYLNKESYQYALTSIKLDAFDGTPESLRQIIKAGISPNKKESDLYIDLTNPAIKDPQAIYGVIRDSLFSYPQIFRVFFFSEKELKDFIKSFVGEKCIGNIIQTTHSTRHPQLPVFYRIASNTTEGKIPQRILPNPPQSIQPTSLSKESLPPKTKDIMFTGQICNHISQSMFDKLKGRPELRKIYYRTGPKGEEIAPKVRSDAEHFKFLQEMASRVKPTT